ncbi:GNAT family acetyltransferase [Mannheimia varigena USDA-ARS-USMARC-1388]|uniref:GNAT family N-acetyltransferase n=1 Tax=Mannheimia varigena TaxID=85404 RepID=UPI0003E38079|nr:GNAT family N-acetyltransferase [Mannheimia varigena]AHG80317.1 GNAT family acetyltransferase [Mannheimia varigena USDA-ARS-USMARC-1388]
MTIQPLLAEHFEQWQKLWQGYKDFYQATVSSEVDLTTWQRIVEQKSICGFGAIIDNKLVGFVHIVLHPCTWEINHICYLEDLFVSPDFRKQGIAESLIKYVYKFAEEQGCKRVYWVTAEDNKIAQHLYDKVATQTKYMQYRKTF